MAIQCRRGYALEFGNGPFIFECIIAVQLVVDMAIVMATIEIQPVIACSHCVVCQRWWYITVGMYSEPLVIRILEFGEIESPQVVKILVIELSTKHKQLAGPLARAYFEVQHGYLMAVSTTRFGAFRRGDCPFEGRYVEEVEFVV